MKFKDLEARWLKMLGDDPEFEATHSDGTLHRGDADIQFKKWKNKLVASLVMKTRVLYSNGESASSRAKHEEYEWSSKCLDSDTHSCMALDIKWHDQTVMLSEIKEYLADLAAGANPQGA